MNTATVHKHFAFGTAPFRFVAVWSAPSKALLEANPEAYNAQLRSKPECCHFSCDHCGTSISNHCIVIDATGKRFCVGTDCVAKTTHTEVISRVKLALRKKAKAARDAKRDAEQQARQAAYNAELDAQRARNSGLTDSELSSQQAAQRAADRTAKISSIAAPILSALQGDYGFVASVRDNLLRGYLPSGKGQDIVLEIMAKQAGRKGSAAFDVAYGQAAADYDRIRAELAQI